MKAMLTEPTSPAKHLARLRKLKKQKTRTEQITSELWTIENFNLIHAVPPLV